MPSLRRLGGLLLVVVFLLTGCSNYPVRHLASDASLITIGKSGVRARCEASRCSNSARVTGTASRTVKTEPLVVTGIRSREVRTEPLTVTGAASRR